MAGVDWNSAKIADLNVVNLFARQRWRAWIETSVRPSSCASSWVRPSAMAGVD